MIVLLFVFYSNLFGVAPTFVLPNEALAVNQALSLYRESDFSIHNELKEYGWGYEDTVAFGEKRYPNKAPGGGLWLWMWSPVVDALSPGPLTFNQLLYGGRVLGLTLPFVLFLYWFGRRLENLVQPNVAWGLILAYAIGSNAGVYATVFFTHNLTAICHAAAFFLLWRDKPLPFFAGLAAGAGVLFETATVLVVPFLLAASWFHSKKIRDLLLLILGTAPGILIHLAYQKLCFGGYFVFPQSIGVREKHQYDAMRVPTLTSIYGLLFSPARGLFFHSPWLLLSLGGLALKGRMSPRVRVFWGASMGYAFVHFVFISSLRFWEGGWSVGPRYLVSVLPFAVIASAIAFKFAPARARKSIALAAAAASVCAIIEHAFYFAAPPYHIHFESPINMNYVRDFAWPYLATGRSVFTVANYFSLSVDTSRLIFFLFLFSIGFIYVKTVWSRSREQGVLLLRSAVFGLALFVGWVNVGHVHAETKKRHLEVAYKVSPFRDGLIERYSFWKK